MAKQNLPTFIKNLIKIITARPQVPPSLEDNKLLNTVLNRRSTRNFSDQEIPDDIFGAILEAGRVAPSTVNLQTWAFATFTDQTWKELFGQPIPFNGKGAVMIMADLHRGKKVLDSFPQRPLVEYTLGVINASLAAMNMNIAAEALGVGSVMLSETGQCGFLDARYLKEKLSLPDGVFPLMTLVLGYPKSGYRAMPPKLPIDQISFTGKYKEAELSILKDWFSQMFTGYKAEHPFSSFDAQLELYRSKIDQAERDLRTMVFYKDKGNAKGSE
jgi:FMN reductase (NADPH)